MKKSEHKAVKDNEVISLYKTQAISQPDKRQKKTGVALPDLENVEQAKDWVDSNKK